MLAFDRPDFPTPLRAGAASAGRSAALTSTAESAHCSKKPYISSKCLWCWTPSGSSDSRSPWTISASTDNPDTMRSRSLLRDLMGKIEQCLRIRAKVRILFELRVREMNQRAGRTLRKTVKSRRRTAWLDLPGSQLQHRQ